MQNQFSQFGQTVTEQLEARQNQQAALRLDTEVREAAVKCGASGEKVGELVAGARKAFAIRNGLARPVKADGLTLWCRPTQACAFVVQIESSVGLRRRDYSPNRQAHPARSAGCNKPGHAEKNLSLIINDLRKILKIFFSRRPSFLSFR